MASFAIEVPGEANPLSENLLVHTLKSASSSDPQQIQSGTKQLQSWEKSQGYYVHLQSAYLDQRLPLEIRYLAIIQLKNGIDKYWRKTATNAVSKQDKEVIRSRLVEGVLAESDNRLALQSALVYSKIARFEFPQEWPDAITSILGTVRNRQDPAREGNALIVLLQITKELSTGRLQRTRQHLQAVTPEMVHAIGERYATNVDSWRHALSEGNGDFSVESAMKDSLLCIKTLRRLLITGYEHPSRDNDVIAFWKLSIQNLGAFMQLRSAGQLTAATKTLLEKHMLQLAKLHHELSRDHPASFALLPDSIQLVHSYWSVTKDFGENFGSKEAVTSVLANGSIGTDGDANDQTVMEKLVLRGLLILRACVKMVHNPTQTFKYKQPQDKEERAQATELLKQHLLQEDFIREIMETVVTRYFVFRESDLREWEEEPEEWEKREDGESEDWEFSIRSCSEKLFLDLAINYKAMLVQPLLQVFYSVATPDNEDVLFKDSVYTAIGLSAPVVHEQLDFDAFIRDVLIQEVQKQKPGFNILRRRVSILLGQWISIKIAEQSRPMVYQIFQHLLTKDGQPLNDQVVRVTAGRQLGNIANDWEFKADGFLPYAEAILGSMMQLIDEVELTETKMALLNTISVIVERLEHNITPFAERIIGLLPPLWEQSGEEHLMKQAILTILARLVNSMKADSLAFHSLVLPIIGGAIEPDSETQVYLLEDALDLWANIIAQTPSSSASDQLLSLAPYLLSIFELGSENLRKALEIADSYLLLAPSHMLSPPLRTSLFTSLTSLIGTLRPDANGLVCNLVEAAVRAAEHLGSEPAVEQTASDLVSTGFLPALLTGLHGSWKAHCTTGPRALDPPVDGIVETDYFSILARLAIASPTTFCQAVQASTQTELAPTMAWLLEEWISHFENIGDPSRRKLMALALTKLLETNQPWILQHLQSLISIWTDVVVELREEAADTALGATGPASASDSLVYSASAPEDGPEAPEDARRRELANADPVHRFGLPEWIKHYLGQALGANANFQDEWLGRVDKDVVKAFGALGIM
ncbi:hypothetical protein Q7P37_004214 [Cladosporium fusiforme]